MTNLYEVFGPHSFHQLQRQIADGYNPTGRELAECLKANAGQVLPAWLLELLTRHLTGAVAKRRGRRKRYSPVVDSARRDLLSIQYVPLLRALQRWKKRGISDHHPFRKQPWWDDTPHVCAAKLLAARINKSGANSIDWRTVSNLVSSRKIELS